MILSIFGTRNSSKQVEQEWIPQIQIFLDKCFAHFFEPFIKQHFPDKQEETAEVLKNLFRDNFEGSNIAHIKKENPSIDIARIIFTLKSSNDKNVSSFIEKLNGIFLSNSSTAYSLSRKYFENERLYLAITLALQETVFDIPNELYKSIERISDDVQKSLTDILKQIINVAKHGNFQSSILTFDEARTRLYRKIAQVDGFVRIPLKQLPTTSLSGNELSEFCVGRSTAIDRLAHYIVKNDGVILISGYRGVGKSTFVNSVLAKLPELEAYQDNQNKWLIVPIQVNVAKVSSPISVLRLCIRTLYHTLLVEDSKLLIDIEKHLDQNEKQLLQWANLCASRKVDMQWSDSINSLRHLEASLNIDASAFLPKPISDSPIKSLLPTFGAKSSKEWNKRIDRSFALLDYDEDRAEEDILTIIEELAKPSHHRNFGIKLAFIFDEMDKIEKDEINLLIKKLKNMFLTRHSIFILITGKEYYYTLLQNQKQEDAVMNSYFSVIQTIPLFTSQDTVELLKRLCKRESNFPIEDELIQTLSLYLTYKARGLPREIIRELQELQEWIPESLVSYVTESYEQKDIFQIYGDLQSILETVIRDEPDSEWKEQIERGLYILMEEFFDEKNTKFDVTALKEIKERIFSLVPEDNFKSILERLGLRLPTIFVKDIDKLDGKVPLFTQVTQGNGIYLVVDEAFYKLTGRVAKASSIIIAQQEIHLSDKDILDHLKQEALYPWKEAFEALQQFTRQDKPISEEIYAQLYRIFVTHPTKFKFTEYQEIQFRHVAAEYLKGKGNINALKYTTSDFEGLTTSFIANEMNEQLLQDLIQLLHQMYTKGGNQSNSLILLEMLNRNKQKPLSDSTLTDLISTISSVVRDDVLRNVVDSLDPNKDISNLIPALQVLEKTSQEILINLLTEYDFNNISIASVQKILKNARHSLRDIWSFLLGHKQKKLAQEILPLILQQWFSTKAEQDIIIQWLNSDNWEADIDGPILNEIAVHYRDSLLIIGQNVNDDTSLAKERVFKALKETEPPPVENVSLQISNPMRSNAARVGDKVAETLQAPYRYISGENVQPIQSNSTSENVSATPASVQEKWLVALSMLTIFAIYLLLPLDISQTDPLYARVIAHLLEAIYFYTGWFGVAFFILSINDIRKSAIDAWIFPWLTIVSLSIAGGSIWLQIALFPLSPTILGQVILIFFLTLFWIPLFYHLG